jgi:hypothetical protein
MIKSLGEKKLSFSQIEIGSIFFSLKPKAQSPGQDENIKWLIINVLRL